MGIIDFIGIKVEGSLITINVHGQKAKVKIANVVYVLGVAIILFASQLPSGLINPVVIVGFVVILAAYEIFGKKRPSTHVKGI